jgi:proteasome regulatory subunit
MQLLSEMDGFSPRGEVKIIAATNRPDMLDQALLRPGRFDRLIEVPLPDVLGRVEILRIHTRRMALAPDVDLPLVALEAGNHTTGADVKAICTEAGMFAIREQRTEVALEHFRSAIAKVCGASIKDAQKVVRDAAFA